MTLARPRSAEDGGIAEPVENGLMQLSCTVPAGSLCVILSAPS